MKILFLFLITQLVSVSFASEKKADCSEVAKKFEELVEKIYKPNVGLLKDVEGSTNWMYWDRLEKAFHAAKKEDLDSLFIGPDRLTYQKVDQLFFDMKSGALKVDSYTERFIEDLYVFLQDHKQLLDGKPDQSYRLLKALEDKDRKMGLSASRTDAAITTDTGMRNAEKTLLNQAIAEMKGEKNASSKWYDGIANFFSSHNKRMANLLNNNNQLRKKMQSSYASVEPVDEALQKYAAILGPDEANQLKGIIASTGNELSEVRQAIEDVYGRQLTSTNPVKTGELRLRELNKSIKDYETPSNTQIALVVEERLNQLDKALKNARERKGMGERPMSEYHPAHLEIRNAQHARETDEMVESYGGNLLKVAPHSDYSVHARWDITFHHSKQVTKQRQASRQVKTGEDASGNDITSTEYYMEDYVDTERWTTSGSDSGNFTLDANYGEVLSGNVDPQASRLSIPSPSYFDSTIDSHTISNVQIVSADTATILRESQRAREIEKPLMNNVAESIEKVAEIKKSYPTLRQNNSIREKAVKELKAIKDDMLKKVEGTLLKYSKLSDQEIKEIWKYESVDSFKERNGLLLTRYLHLANRMDHFAEQVSRNVENLELNFMLPDYTAEMKTLDEFAAKNLKIQVVTGATVGVGAAAAAGYNYYEHQKKTDPETVSYETRAVQRIKPMAQNYGESVHE